MISVKVGSKIVKIDEHLQIVEHNLEDFDIYTKGGAGNLEPDASFVDVSIKLDDGESDIPHDLIIFKRKRNALYLHHLSARGMEGQGFGKLGLALFWAACETVGTKKFALRFGRARKSLGWLKHIGFQKKHINTIHDHASKGRASAVVGKVKQTDEPGKLGDILPIEFSEKNFPTGFFEYRIGENFTEQVQKDIRKEEEMFNNLDSRLQGLEQEAEFISSCLSNLYIEKDPQKIRENLEQIKELCDPGKENGFTRRVQEIEQLFEEEGFDSSEWQSFTSLTELVENQKGSSEPPIIEERIERARQELLEDREKEEEIAGEKGWTKQKAVREQKYQEKIYHDLFKALSTIPDLEAVSLDIMENKKDYIQHFSQ